MLTSRRRAELRSQAHHLQATVHIGHHGITPALLQSLDDVLRTTELVKVQFAKTADVKVKDAANELAGSVTADVVQVIGRTATLYRENPELHKD